MPLQFQHWLFLCGCSVGLQHDVSLSPCCLHHFSTVLHTVALLHDVSFSTAMGIIFFSRWNCEHILSSFSFTFLKDILPSTLRERRKGTIYTVWKEMGYANINTTTSNHACTQMLIQMWIPMKLGEKTCSSDQLEWVAGCDYFLRIFGPCRCLHPNALHPSPCKIKMLMLEVTECQVSCARLTAPA